jgi:hypothetical protein
VAQNTFPQQRIAALQMQGATGTLVNQQQVIFFGVRVGINRPDLQYTLGLLRHYEEFDTVPASGYAHEMRIRANDPAGRSLSGSSSEVRGT